MTTTTTNRYSDLLDKLAQGDTQPLEQLEPIDTPTATSPSDRTPVVFAVALAGIGGLILGIALGSSYIAPLVQVLPITWML